LKPIHNVPIYLECHSVMIPAHEHPQFDPVHTRQLLEHINGLFAFERDFGVRISAHRGRHFRLMVDGISK
jgi:hypothetical protein